ncbi:hypothetical protein PtA15_13A450 [Puccinia triticina]|uniref:Uncharacterized protein n=1 Tax=Puccinia triticina TaxID=208348 RepID=A0ABY7D0E7_9BASI|nr:uncharacterized protein PtA15_13A450 [Puccinia triticina]WAQ91049.1 hypothetical protein PtA15_13A450 [Puccinia triticina]WAR61242.1 hypothetical protein PtB15_13B495 [Puccinia triticina]
MCMSRAPPSPSRALITFPSKPCPIPPASSSAIRRPPPTATLQDPLVTLIDASAALARPHQTTTHPARSPIVNTATPFLASLYPLCPSLHNNTTAEHSIRQSLAIWASVDFPPSRPSPRPLVASAETVDLNLARF